MKKPTLRQQLADAQQVCFQAYQVVGSLMYDLDKFDTAACGMILDNLAAAKPIHNVLPWGSYKDNGAVLNITPQKHETIRPTLALPSIR